MSTDAQALMELVTEINRTAWWSAYLSAPDQGVRARYDNPVLHVSTTPVILRSRAEWLDFKARVQGEPEEAQKRAQQLRAAEHVLTLFESHSHQKFDLSTGTPRGRCVWCSFLFDLFHEQEREPHHPLCPIGALVDYRAQYPRAEPLGEAVMRLIKEVQDGSQPGV